MSDLTTEQDAAVKRVIARCRAHGGHQMTFSGKTALAEAVPINGNRNTIQWWVGDDMTIQGIAEFDFEGNRVK